VAPLASASGLGISLSFEKSDQTDAESSGRIWGGGESGTTFERVMIIDSLSSDTVQQISFEVYDQVTENEETSIDFTQPSRITDWIVFEPEAPVLQPGTQQVVKITFNIPAGTNDGAFNASIRTLSSGVDTEAELDSEAGTQAVIGTRIAIDTKVWLGVGDALALAPTFEIVGVDGALINEEKFVRVFFENTGISPIQPSGRFQLSDPNFADRIFEPVDFQMKEISGGQISFTDIPVPLDVEDGFFRAFVTAQEGEVRITRLFEAELVFDDPSKLSIPDLAIRIAAFVLAAIGLVFGVRLIRGNNSKAPRAPREPRQPRAPRPAKPPRIAIRRPEPKVEQPILRRYEPPPLPSWYSTPEPAPKPKRFSLRPRVQAKPQVEDPLEELKSAVLRMEKQLSVLNTDFAATKAPENSDIAVKPKRVQKPRPTTSTRNKVPASKLEPEVTTLPKKPAARKPAAGSAKKS